MNESYNRIIELAIRYKDPTEFIEELHKLLSVQQSKADSFYDIGVSLINYSFFSHSARVMQIALDNSIESKDRKQELRCHISLGYCLYKLGEHQKAIDHHSKALKIALEIKDKNGQGTCYTYLGLDYYGLGRDHEAEEFQNKALDIAHKIDDKVLIYKSCTNLGLLYQKQGDYDRAKVQYEYALEAAIETSDEKGEWNSRRNLASVFYRVGEYPEAIDQCDKALKIALKTGDKKQEGSCYTFLGMLLNDQGNVRMSREPLEKALKIAQETGDKKEEGICNTNLANVFFREGNYLKAQELYQNALHIAREVGDKAVVGRCYGNLGLTSDRLGQYEKAIKLIETSLQIALEIDDKVTVQGDYDNLAGLYEGLGNNQKAQEYREKGRRISLEIGDKKGKATRFLNQGLEYYERGDYVKAKEQYNKSLEIALKNNYTYMEIECYNELGIVSYDQLNYNEARELFEKSLKIALKIGYKEGESQCYNELGMVYYKLGDQIKAEENLKKSVKFNLQIGDIQEARTSSRNLGIFYREINQLNLAYEHLKNSIEYGESIGAKLIEERHKIGFYGLESNTYELIVPICVELGKNEKAFEFVERSKSKAFIITLTSSNIKPNLSLQSSDRREELEKLLVEEENINKKLELMQMKHFSDTARVLDTNSDEPTTKSNHGDESVLDSLLKQRDSIYDRLEPIDPEYAFLRRGKPVSYNKLQNLFLENSDVALVEYFLTPYRIFIFVLWKGDLHVQPVNVNKEYLVHYIENYKKEVMDYPNFRKSGNPSTSSWLELSDFLIAPISDYLKNSKLVYFVPHDILHYIPLHALSLNYQPLIRTHPVVYSSSASLLPFYQNKGTDTLKSCATFGVEFVDEAKDVAAIFNGNVFPNVSKEQVLRNLSNDILHFSCHGLFDDRNPLSSGLELKDSNLTAKEIFDLKLNSELVTLSACETGISDTKPGDELIGLTRAFIYAGAPSLVVSLWSVEDSSTKELMHEFYTNLKNGDQKAVALQKAQLRIMDKYRLPFYWAPFILIGDWD